jgi:hypothetical protein
MQDTLASSVSSASESLWQVACDPDRIATLHGLVGEFCHSLRNRLSSLQMGIYLARRDEVTTFNRAVWDELDSHYRAAQRVVELFQVVCRPMTLTLITVGLELVFQEFASRWTPKFASRGVTLVTEIVEAAGPSRLDPARLAQGLDTLATWRIDQVQPGARLVLRGWVGQGESRIEWSEDRVSGCDHRGELPLAVLARVATAHQGTMDQESSEGWRVRVDWPHANLGGSA